MQMKKTLGILLAVCFLMSVTAASVSAAEKSAPLKHFEKVKYKLVKIPAHFECKLVKKLIGYKHHKPVYKAKMVKIFVPTKWIKVLVKVPVYKKVPVYNNNHPVNNNNNNHHNNNNNHHNNNDNSTPITTAYQSR